MNFNLDRVLGLEIAEDKIKILEVALTSRGLEPVVIEKIALPPNSVREGTIIQPKLVADALSPLIKENKFSTKKTIALINPPYIFTRIIRLPHNLSDEQIRMNLEAELSQYRIFIGRDSIIDFRKLEEISEDGIKKINVLFAATFRTLSQSYLKTLELAGLDLIGIDVPILSALRILDEVDIIASSLDVTLFILVGQKYLEMCILKGNRPRFLHSIEIDMFDFDKNRADFLDRFISAIKLVVNFYQARFIQGEEIARIIINPLDAKYSQIHTLLQEKLPQIPIQISRPLNKIFTEKQKSETLDELRFSFSPLLGAVLRIEDKESPFNLNLLLEQRMHRQYRLNQTYLLFACLAFVLSVMIISFGWVVLKINIVQRKISNLSMQLQQPSSQLNKAISIKEKKDTLARQIKEATIITHNLKKPFYFKNITKASVLVPSQLWLTDIALDERGSDLLITGESKTEKPIFDYISALSGSNYFKSVELVSSKGGTESIKFIIRCKIK